jgi:hypothetical protein
MLLALVNWSITSVVKLHPTNMLLFPSPVASSSNSLFVIYGSPQNGNSSKLIKSRTSLAYFVLHHLAPQHDPIGISSS